MILQPARLSVGLLTEERTTGMIPGRCEQEDFSHKSSVQKYYWSLALWIAAGSVMMGGARIKAFVSRGGFTVIVIHGLCDPIHR